MPRPLVVSPSQLRRELGGAAMNEFLDALADPDLLEATPRDDVAVRVSVDAALRELIEQAQSDFEIATRVLLSHTKIVSHPVSPDKVRDTDYDLADDPYDWDAANWRGGGTIRLRFRPLVSLQGVGLKLGQGPLNTVRQFDPNWISRKTRLGVLNVLAFFGRGGANPAGTVGALPHWQLATGQMGGGIWNGGHIAGMVYVDYTAGLLPRDFDPDTDKAYDACRDFNVEAAIGAVKMRAAFLALQSVQDAVGAGGGSISMDGLSENYDPNRFMQRMQGYETRYAAKLNDVRREWGGGVLMFSK